MRTRSTLEARSALWTNANVSFLKERATVLVLACIEAASTAATAPWRRSSPSKIGRASRLPPANCQILPGLRSIGAVRCRNRRPKDGATRTCPTSTWKSTSAWPERVQPMSLSASEQGQLVVVQPLGMRAEFGRMPLSATNHQLRRSSCLCYQRGRLRHPDRLRRPRWPQRQLSTNIPNGSLNAGRPGLRLPAKEVAQL
jgi:hypothetical protein